MDCLFISGSKWWPQVSSAATVQDKKASPSASEYANNFKGLVFSYFLFIYSPPPTMRLWGTHLAHNFEYPRSRMIWVTHCWMLERLYTVFVMYWSLQIVVSALSSISGLTAVTGRASDMNHGALLSRFGSCALFAQQPAVFLLNVELL